MSKRGASTPTVEKSFPSGAWAVSDIINGRYVHRIYMGYTKRQAVQQFKHDTKGAN